MKCNAITRKIAMVCSMIMVIVFVLTTMSSLVVHAAEVTEEGGVYEEFADETPHLTSELNDTSYEHDCSVSLFIYLQPDHERFGNFGYDVTFTDSDYNTYMYNISKHEVKAALQDGSNEVKAHFYLPKGEWSFSVYAAQGITTDDVQTLCFQEKLSAKTDGIYQIHAISGTPEWVEKNQHLIPAAYRVIGEDLLDKSEVVAMNITDSDNGFLDPATLNADQLEALGDDVRLLFSNADLESAFPGRNFSISAKYYKVWNTWHWVEDDAEDAYKTDFNAYIIANASDNTVNLDLLFEKYCLGNESVTENTDTEITDSTKVSAAEDVTVEIKEYSAMDHLKGIGSVLIILAVAIGGTVYNNYKKKKANSDEFDDSDNDAGEK